MGAIPPLALGERLGRIIDVAESIGMPISNATALRWAIHGRKGVRLWSVKGGRGRLTSRTALLQFLEAVDRIERPWAPREQAPQTPAEADAVLAAFGIPRKDAQEVRP